MVVTETHNAFAAFSDDIMAIVERAASSVVAVHGGGRWAASGIHWRSGVLVTAEERLERDENITLTLPGGREIEASLAGRDPTTDVAVLRFQADGLPLAATADVPARAGQVVLAVGAQNGAALAGLGIVAFAGGAWRSMRGGTIDSLIRLDLRLSPAAEGGALVDVHGHVMGMAVLGPRGRALAIPAATMNRAVDQLLTKGHVVRGYLGAGLQALPRDHRAPAAAGSSSGQGLIVVSIDQDGPSARAGLLVGDIVTTWNADRIERVRDVMHRLGPESAGNAIDLTVTRGGSPKVIKVVVGERPVT
jgi:S1-C subfamily serine protease